MSLIKIFKNIIPIFILLNIGYGLELARPSKLDSKIKYLSYKEGQRYLIYVKTNHETALVFSTDESIENVYCSKKSDFNIDYDVNKLFFKPIKNNINDQVIIETNKHLYPMTVKSSNNPSLIIFVDRDNKTLENNRLNYNYIYFGNKEIAPLQVFNNKNKTYFQFSSTQNIPVILASDNATDFIPLKTNFQNQYITITGIYKIIKLLYKDKVTYIVNRSYGKI